MSINKFTNLFGHSKGAVIGMVHVEALPGSPKNKASMKNIISTAVQEAEIYVSNGVDGIMLENMHDLPYLNSANIGLETTACMASLCTSVRASFKNIPFGVQILKSGNMHAMAVAKAAGCDFIRVEGYVFSHIADAGFVDATAGKLLRYRKQLDADVLIFTDIKKKHSSHSVTMDTDIITTATAAQFFHSDGVIVTGTETGKETSSKEVADLVEKLSIPVLVGSGVTSTNVRKFMNASAMIVGSHFKLNGDWNNDVDESRVKEFMKIINEL